MIGPNDFQGINTQGQFSRADLVQAAQMSHPDIFRIVTRLRDEGDTYISTFGDEALAAFTVALDGLLMDIATVLTEDTEEPVSAAVAIALGRLRRPLPGREAFLSGTFADAVVNSLVRPDGSVPPMASPPFMRFLADSLGLPTLSMPLTSPAPIQSLPVISASRTGGFLLPPAQLTTVPPAWVEPTHASTLHWRCSHFLECGDVLRDPPPAACIRCLRCFCEACWRQHSGCVFVPRGHRLSPA